MSSGVPNNSCYTKKEARPHILLYYHSDTLEVFLNKRERRGDRKLRCLCKSFLRTAAARCRIAESVSVMEAHQVLLVQDTKRGKEKESNILESLFSVIDKPRSPVPKLEKDMKRLKGKAKPPMRELESLLRQPQNN